MPVRVHMSRKELEALIEETKANGNDASLLEQLLAETAPEKPATKNPGLRTVTGKEWGSAMQGTEESVTSPEELERLRTLACPHIGNSPFWEDFVSRRVLVCTICKETRLGEFGEHRQPPLL